MIILTILKVILKIILILLLIVLLLLTLLLLLRLKYSVAAQYEDSLDAEAQLSVLFGALTVIYRIGGEEPGLELKIFGRSRKRAEDESPPADDTDIDADPDMDLFDDLEDEEVQPDAGGGAADEVKPQPLEEETKPQSTEEEDIPKDGTVSESNKKGHGTKKPQKESAFKKLKNTFAAVDNFRERYDIPLLLHNLKVYLFSQLRSFGVRGGSINGVLGLSDPSQTGLALGGIGIIRAFAPLEIDIEGEFEKSYIALNGSLYGKTYLLKLIIPVLALIVKKPVRTILYDCLIKKGNKK